MNRVAFLALDDIHHLHHILPIAFELSQDPDYDCVIYLQKHSLTLTNKMATLYPKHRCKIQVLTPSWLYRCFRFHPGIYSARRVIRDHAKLLLQFDALLTPDMNLHELIAQATPLKKKPLFIAITHGAGDSNAPFYRLSEYDFVLLCGEKRRRLFTQKGYISEEKSKVTGYPKFDLVAANFRPRLFTHDLPICLYNPHSELKICSWKKWGLEILEYFYSNRNYNLIFAPHCNLFKRYLSPEIIPKKYFHADNLLLDLGSENSVNMTYTQAADIYIGDLSSQFCEFIRQPRPCVFLNAWEEEWQGKELYDYWNFGTVISDFSEFKKFFSQNVIDNPQAEQQKNHFNDIFSTTAESAGSRAATAIKDEITKARKKDPRTKA